MKYRIILFIIIVYLAGCSGNNDKSDAYGNFEATEVVVSAQAQGAIVEFNIEEGQVLEEGAFVGLIDTVDLSLKKLQLQKQVNAVTSRITTVNSQIEVQEQQRENLLTDQRRMEKLFKDGAATKKQLDDINGAVDLINAQIEATRSQKDAIFNEIAALRVQIEQVEEALRKCRIVNPIDGTVLTKFSEKGELANFGKPLYKIADLENIKLKVYVSGAQLPHIKLGQEVEVLIDEDREANRRLSGTISWISETAEFTPKTIQTKEERVNLVYAVKVLVPNDGSLKIGMPGEVNFN